MKRMPKGVTTKIDIPENESHLPEVDTRQVEVASSTSMEHALELVAQRFRLGENYMMIAFADGANSCKIVLANNDFEVAVKIRDKVAMNFPEIED